MHSQNVGSLLNLGKDGFKRKFSHFSDIANLRFICWEAAAQSAKRRAWWAGHCQECNCHGSACRALIWICMQSTAMGLHAKHCCGSACKTALWVCMQSIDVDLHTKHHCGSACKALLWVCVQSTAVSYMQSTAVGLHEKHCCGLHAKHRCGSACKALTWVSMFVKHRRGSACQTAASSAQDNSLFSSGQQEVQLSKWHQPRFKLNTLHFHNNDTPMIRKVSQKKKCIFQCRHLSWAHSVLTPALSRPWTACRELMSLLNSFLVTSKRYLWTVLFLVLWKQLHSNKSMNEAAIGTINSACAGALLYSERREQALLSG